MNKNIIFGAGVWGKKTLKMAQDRQLIIDYFCDNDSAKWGSKIDGVVVISPENLAQMGNDVNVFIANAKNSLEIQKQLNHMNSHYNICEPEDIIGMSRISNFFCEDPFKNIEYSDITEDDPLVSIVIKVNEETVKFLGQCVYSVRNSNITVPYEILIWNQADIIPIIRGEQVALICANSLTQKDWITHLQNQYKQAGEKAVVGSKTIDNTGINILQAGYILWNDFEYKEYGNNCSIMEPEFEYVREVDALSETGLLFSVNLWEIYMKSYLEWNSSFEAQMNFCLLCREHGIPLIFQPLSLLIDINPVKVDRGILKNKKFTDRWGTFVKKEQFAQTDGMSLRVINRKRFNYRMLLADSNVAEYDTNAGNRAVYNYIQIFLELKIQIIYVIDDMQYSNRYTSFFQQMGILVTYGERWKKNKISLLKKWSKDFDYAFLNRPIIAKQYTSMLRENVHTVITYSGCDLHYLRLFREYGITKQDETLRWAKQMKIIEDELLNEVDFVGYPSWTEVNLIKNQNPEAVVQYFPLFFYEKRTCLRRLESTEGILFVGGFAHSPNVDAACWFVNDIVPLLREGNISDIIYLVGSNPPDKVCALQDTDIIVTGYIDDETLQKYYRKCKISVAPLRYGAGMKGKVLEAMYEGIPLVTTDIGAEGLLDLEGILEIGNTAEEIADKISLYYTDDYKCAEVSEKEQQYIMEHFTKQSLKRLLLKQLESKKGDYYKCEK